MPAGTAWRHASGFPRSHIQCWLQHRCLAHPWLMLPAGVVSKQRLIAFG